MILAVQSLQERANGSGDVFYLVYQPGMKEEFVYYWAGLNQVIARVGRP